MRRPKRPRLTERQTLCLFMIGDHGLTGSFTEFSRPHTRRTVHQLKKKKLVQWVDGRWLLTLDGHTEWTQLVIDSSRKSA